jgi:hypothetical protein
MKLYMLPPMLVCFLAGIALDMTLSRVVIDVIFIAAMAGTIVVSALIMRYPRPHKKTLPRRSQLKVVKSRRAKTSGTSGRRLSNFNR